MSRKLLTLGCILALACVGAVLAAHAIDAQPVGGAFAHLDLHTFSAMAVVTKYGTGARDPASLKDVDGIFAHAEARFINSQISIANGDSIGSTYWIGNVPSNAIIDPNSAYDYQAITGVTLIDVGFNYPNGGAVIDDNNLITGDDVTAAGAQTLKGHGTLTTANGMKRAWELAGLTSDPGGELAIVATLKAAATAAGVINWFIRYLKSA